jgi:hypothetical protein
MSLRLADAFSEQDGEPVGDADFLVTCTCGLTQRVDTMILDELGQLTLYECSRCENTLVAILTEEAAVHLWLSSSAMARRGDASGHRRNGYVIGSRVDVALRRPGAEEDALLINSTADLFDALRNI